MKAILLLCSWLLSCGAQPQSVVQHWEPPESGTGVFYLRYNLPNALLDRVELGFEVKAGGGWERVSIAIHDTDDRALQDLQDQVGIAPNQILPVVAALSPELESWSGNHHCRRLTVLETDSLKVKQWANANQP